MTSAHKINANRVNARASTGPRTAPGKARAAQNARRHGLSASVLADPSTAEDVVALAQEIAGENATPELRALALRIAEGQIGLVRVRRARHNLLNQYLGDPYYESRKTGREKLKFFMRFAKGSALLAPVPDYVLAMINMRPRGPQKFADILAELVNQLAIMDRYERRALSRRKFAIRDFVALREQNKWFRAAADKSLAS